MVTISHEVVNYQMGLPHFFYETVPFFCLFSYPLIDYPRRGKIGAGTTTKPSSGVIGFDLVSLRFK